MKARWTFPICILPDLEFQLDWPSTLALWLYTCISSLLRPAYLLPTCQPSTAPNPPLRPYGSHLQGLAYFSEQTFFLPDASQPAEMLLETFCDKFAPFIPPSRSILTREKLVCCRYILHKLVARFPNFFRASSREGGSEDSDELVTKLFEVWFYEVLLTRLSCSENLSVQKNMQVPVRIHA